MERKTIKIEEGSTGVGSKYGLVAKNNDLANVDIFNIVDTLGEYEDIDMTPSEILETIKAIKMLYTDFPSNLGKATDMMPLAVFESKFYKSLNSNSNSNKDSLDCEMTFEIGKIADTLVQQMSLFNCDMQTAWREYMHDLLKSQFSYDEVKEYVDKKIKQGEVDDGDNKNTTRQLKCPLIGGYCDKEHHDCNKCMKEEENQE